MSDLEHKILSKLIDPDECKKAYNMGLRMESFEDLGCRAAYGWMMEYWRDNNCLLAPTWVVMEHEFPTIKLDAEVEESLEWMVGAIQQRYLINQTQDVIMKASLKLDADPEAAVSQLWKDVYAIAESTVPRNVRVNMIENIEERRASYDAKAADAGAIGAPFGFDELDAHTRGIYSGELAAVAAYTKVGKSWALCKAIAAAQQQGLRPILFSLEMTLPSIQERVDAIVSGVSYSRLHDGELMPDELERLHRAQDEMRDRGNHLLIERPQRGERTVKGMLSRSRQTGCDYLLVDQLSFVDAEQLYTGDRVLTAKHTDLIFELKDEIGRESAGTLPCYLAVQLNRETMRTGGNGGRGELWNFANASFIEQTVDMALGLWRNDDMRSNNLMGLDIMGSRRTDKQSWLLEWRLNDRTSLRIREEYTGD